MSIGTGRGDVGRAFRLLSIAAAGGETLGGWGFRFEYCYCWRRDVGIERFVDCALAFAIRRLRSGLFCRAIAVAVTCYSTVLAVAHDIVQWRSVQY